MIRLIQRRLIIPRGDTGSFSIPVLKNNTDNIAVFTIFDEITKTRMFQKMIPSEGDVINIAFTHSDTVNLKPGRYVWDIKYYSNPEFIDDELVNGNEIDSYYAGFSLPVCEIRETADNYLVSPDGPNAKLSPEQLEIVTGAMHSLNEAIRKTQENVEHYPEIRDEVWYVWDAESGDYVSTGVRANGIVGNGIESAVLNDDYTLTLNFTDGTSFTSPSIRGEKGNGIDDIVLNNDFTLTIRYTDGESYTTPAIRGPVGPTPQFSIGTVQDGAVAAASITGTAENPVLNLTLPNANVPTKVSELENDADYAVDANYVHTDNNYTTAEKEKLSSIAVGAQVNVKSDWNATSGDAQILNKPTKVSDFTNDTGYLTEHQDISGKADKSEIPTKVSQLQNDSGYLTSFTESDPTVPAWAKEPNKPSYTAEEVGAPTVAEMNTAIGEAIGQLNSFDIAVVQALPTQDISTHTIYLVPKIGETNDVYDEYIYINSKWEMVGNTQIDLSNYVQKTDYATASNAGVVKIAGAMGIDITNGFLTMATADHTYIQDGTHARKAIPPKFQHESAFYGLAKAAGDSTQSTSSNAVGTYTDEAKAAIQTMLDVPAKGDIPEVPVQDVQVNGVSVLQDGVANVPIVTTNSGIAGVVKVNAFNGLTMNNDVLSINVAYDTDIKAGTNYYKPITPVRQHQSTFYGLAKAAGADMKNIANTTVGVYPDAQKEAIQSMLGITQMLAPENPNLVATQAYSIGDVFAANGHLYKATAAIAQDGAIIPDTNCVETTMVDAGGKIKDVRVVGSSVVGNDGVANIPVASHDNAGVIKIYRNGTYGLTVNSSGYIQITPASTQQIKAGASNAVSLSPSLQEYAVYYGLSKLAGEDLKNDTVTVGQYPETSKTAIKAMLGVQDGLKVVRLI